MDAYSAYYSCLQVYSVPVSPFALADSQLQIHKTYRLEEGGPAEELFLSEIFPRLNKVQRTAETRHGQQSLASRLRRRLLAQERRKQVGTFEHTSVRTPTTAPTLAHQGPTTKGKKRPLGDDQEGAPRGEFVSETRPDPPLHTAASGYRGQDSGSGLERAPKRRRLAEGEISLRRAGDFERSLAY